MQETFCWYLHCRLNWVPYLSREYMPLRSALYAWRKALGEYEPPTSYG